MNYPKKGELIEAKTLENAVWALQKKAKDCLGLAEEAKLAFEKACKLASGQAVGAFVGVARALARSTGEPSAASDMDLSGAAWARLDVKFKLGLGLEKLASKQVEEKARMMSQREALVASLPMDKAQRRALVESLVLEKSKVEELATTLKTSKKRFDAHREDWLDVYESHQLETAEQALEYYKEESSLGDFFGTDYARQRKIWNELLESGVDLPAMKSLLGVQDQQLQSAREKESSLSRIIENYSAIEKKIEECQKDLERPCEWVDEKSRVDSRFVYGQLGGSVNVEAALVAMSKALPSARAEARAAMRSALVAETLDLGTKALVKETTDLKKMSQDCSVLARRMAELSKDNPMAKVSASFDFKALSERLSARHASLLELRGSGPRKTVEKIEAMDWSDRPELSLERIEELEKRAIEKFGPKSEAAKALGQGKKVVSAGGESTGMGAWYWSDLLGGAADNYMAMEAVEGVAELAVAGVRTMASSSGSASAAFDLGWISEGLSWGEGASTGIASGVAESAAGAGVDLASGLADAASSFDFGEALSAGADVLGDLASGLGDLASGIGDIF